MKIRITPTCTKCPAAPRASEAYQTAFIVEDTGTKCGGCGLELNAKHFTDFEVPEFAQSIVKSMVTRNMMRIEVAGKNIGTTSGQISAGVSLSLGHRVESVGGVISWYEIDYTTDFKPHETDFAGIKKYAPLASAMLDEFLADGFVVSEAPGVEGRRLRDAHIRLVKYVTVESGEGESLRIQHYKLRGFLTWNFKK